MKDKLLELGYSDEQCESILNKSKIYFQSDVDNIVDKRTNTLTKEFESKYNALLNDTNKMKLENDFVLNGGNKSAFNDFYESTKSYDFSQDKAFEKLRNEKPYFFNKNTFFNEPKLDFEKERKTLLDDNGLISGTIYRKG